MSNNSNAPFVSTKIYPLVTGESNSPFTDQRAVEAGGGGGGGLGNVIYDGSRLNVDNGAGSTVITNIDYTNAPLTIQNDGGGLTFNAATDSSTLRGDTLLELTSSVGDVKIEAGLGDVNIVSAVDVNINSSFDVNIVSAVGVNINSLLGDIGIVATDGNVTLTMGSQSAPSTGVYNNDSYKNTDGDLFAWRNREPVTGTTGTLIGGFKMARDSGGNELLICDDIDTFSFAGNNTAIPTAIKPVIRFNQIPNTGCSLRFDNAPQAIGNILTVTGGDGSVALPYTLNWQPPASGSGDVTYNSTTRQLSSGDPSAVIAILNAPTPMTIQSIGATNQSVKLESQRTSAGFTLSSSTYESGIGTIRTGQFHRLQCIGTGNQNRCELIMEIDTSANNAKRMEFAGIDRFEFCRAPPGGIQVNSPIYNFRNTNAGAIRFYQYSNDATFDATNNYYLSITGGDGSVTTPYLMTWQPISGGGSGTANANLVLNYDTSTSTLILSDPADNLPVISTTQVVPGRTVLIKDVIVNGTTELSALGLSNSVFPPPLSGQTGFFDGLIGNSPPRVSLNPLTGLTNWFPGASFKISLAGEITKIGGYDDIILKVYSNRGQLSQNILNNFSMITRSVNPPPKLGWNWVVDFTCRSVNDGNTLGVISTSSNFNYTDDSYTLETYGAIVSNTNSSFDTSVEQFLDCTIEFDYYNDSNNIKTTLCTIERIF
jgi:hypothetical protein